MSSAEITPFGGRNLLVRMKTQILATRPGGAWPEVGGTVDVPDIEGAELCAHGYAVPVKTAKKAAKTTPG